MSTTIHVGKSRRLVVVVTDQTGKVVPFPDGWALGWAQSLDGGNMTLNSNGADNSCTFKCVGVAKQGDYIPGRPVAISAILTSQDGKTTTSIHDQVNLVAADTSVPAVPLPGPNLNIGFSWGPEF
jgi:hypothetical protein